MCLCTFLRVSRDKVIVGYREVERPFWADPVNESTVNRVRARIANLVHSGATAAASAARSSTSREGSETYHDQLDASGQPGSGKVNLAPNQQPITWLPVHVLDLAADGYITPHVDSVKFSGDLVCGVSLLSSAVMTLAPESPPEVASAFDAKARLYLPRRSLYVLSGNARYHFTHSVEGGDASWSASSSSSGSTGSNNCIDSTKRGNSKHLVNESMDENVFKAFGENYERERRISLIFRDAKVE